MGKIVDISKWRSHGEQKRKLRARIDDIFARVNAATERIRERQQAELGLNVVPFPGTAGPR